MARPHGTYCWPPIEKELLWKWYWDDLMTLTEIARRWARKKPTRVGTYRKYPTDHWVRGQLKRHSIPRRTRSADARLWQLKTKTPIQRLNRYPHRAIYENHYKVELSPHEQVHHKDHIDHNNHPLNLELMTVAEHTAYHVGVRTGHNKSSRPRRIPLFEVYMRMAENIAQRSHHGATKVGCVITSFDLRRVLSVGFNGNARGLEKESDSPAPGQSQLIHAEENALIQAGEHSSERVMFVTYSPCLMCIKLAVTAGIKYIYYRKPYRDRKPLGIARYLGVMVCHYNKWAKTKW